MTRRQISSSAIERHARTAAAAAPRSPKKTAPAQAVTGAEGSTATREELEAQLNAARAQVVELQNRLNSVTDRLAWVSDRLHDLLDDSN